MVTKATLRGVKGLFRDLDNALKRTSVLAVQSTVDEAITRLKENTPKDTGEAREGWVGKVNPDGSATIENPVEHIDNLNRGSSQQAPERFIERTLLEFPEIEPNGVIVETRPER